MCGGALFSMHFGASSMVWPMNWGKESGTSLLSAFAGAFITSLFLVIIGYVALAKSNSTYSKMTTRITGKKFGLFFTCLTIAVNGPLYVIPRMSAASWDSIVQAFGLTPQNKLPLIIFTVLFYLLSYFFLMNPGKAMDKISTMLFPILLVIVITVVVKGLISPLGVPTGKEYSGSSFAYGFTNGYATGEILCALIFGQVILNSLKTKGVSDKKMSSNMVRVGIAGIAMLTCTHLAHMIIGATSATTFPDLNYTALYTAVAAAEYGKVGGYLFTFALFLAALTTAVGMTSGCAEFFADATDGKLTYKKTAIAILVLSALFGCLGLAGILTYLGPIPDGVYPPTIVLVIYYALAPRVEQPRLTKAAKWSIYVAFVFGMLDMIWKYFVKFNIFENICALYEKIPLAGVSLAWFPWTVLAFVVGLLLHRNEIRSEKDLCSE